MLILVTATAFLVAAIDSYNYDMDPANGVDIMEGMGAAFLIIIGGFVILCELDLFFTVYYFLMKPKTLNDALMGMVCFTPFLNCPSVSGFDKSSYVVLILFCN